MSLVEDISELCRDRSEIVRILVTSDLNLGYSERSADRCHESFEALEEVLALARNERADLVLLTGNLFHHAEPSQKTVNRTIEILNEFCLGDARPAFEVSSRVPSALFETVNFTSVNFENPKLNVSLPIFSIYGNHDNSGGACRLLETCGLVNFFGRHTNYEQIDLVPIFIVKNSTTFALVGMSNFPERKLREALRQQKVNVYKSSNDWIHVLALHQNRLFEQRVRSADDQKKLRAEDVPSIFDLIIWGHEHECRPKPERVGNSERYVLQPGSTIATSLTKGEAVPKHAFILEIYKNFYAVQSRRLATARPFLYKVLENPLDATEVNHRFIVSELEEMLRGLRKEQTNMPKMPLIKLIVNVQGERRNCKVSLNEIASLFATRISNSANCVSLCSADSGSSVSSVSVSVADRSDRAQSMTRSERNVPQLLGYVQRYFETEADATKLAAEPLRLLNEALCNCLTDHSLETYETTVNNQAFRNIKRINADLEDIDLDTFLSVDIVRMAVQKHCDGVDVSEEDGALEAQAPQHLDSDGEEEMETNENEEPEPQQSARPIRHVTKRKRAQAKRSYSSDSDEFLPAM